MEFKSFRIKIIIRIILIAGFMFVFVFSIYQDKWYVTSTTTLLISILLIVEFIRFSEKIRKEITNFVLSIKQKDFTSISPVEESGQNRKQAQLKDAFAEIVSEFQNIRIEKEIHYQYILNIIEHIDMALVCITERGDIEMINNAAKNLLGMQTLDTIPQITKTHPDLGVLIDGMQAGDQKLFKNKINGVFFNLSIRCTEFKLKDTGYRLISFQDIKSELEAQELESWQRLIRVLTHEIMNSVTPISSLSTAINETLVDDEGEKIPLRAINPVELDDLHQSIKTIENRSKGLLKFVDTYKSITKIPKPRLEKVDILKLLLHVKILMKPELDKKKIDLMIDIKESPIESYIDHEMITRVLINLIVNAADALKNRSNPLINIVVRKDTGNRINIEISDNGCGMENEILENVFVPFFTTKEKGSGIGLSVSRQIMHLHKGSIEISSTEGKGSVVVLRL